jgi:hypothetical protein
MGGVIAQVRKVATSSDGTEDSRAMPDTEESSMAHSRANDLQENDSIVFLFIES